VLPTDFVITRPAVLGLHTLKLENLGQPHYLSLFTRTVCTCHILFTCHMSNMTKKKPRLGHLQEQQRQRQQQQRRQQEGQPQQQLGTAQSAEPDNAAPEGETEAAYLMRRAREFNVATRERPEDLQMWLDFATFQDEALARLAPCYLSRSMLA
jgi:hemolysin activation/secretion protein